MGKRVLFLDSVKKDDGSYNVTYGTDDINAIVRSLTGAGVSLFPSGETFNVSDLNAITEAMVSEGVSFNGLKVSLSDGKIKIAQGIGFFENGATISVDEEGIELEYKIAETLYVFAEYDSTLNVCDFCTSESAPATAEGVYRLMLATIEADGTITDRRAVAISKVGSMGKNITRDIVVMEESSEYKDYIMGDVIFVFDMISPQELSKYNTIQITGYARYISSFTTTIKLENLLSAEGNSITIATANVSATIDDSAIAIRFIDEKLQLYVPDTGDNTTLELKQLSVKLY